MQTKKRHPSNGPYAVSGVLGKLSLSGSDMRVKQLLTHTHWPVLIGRYQPLALTSHSGIFWHSAVGGERECWLIQSTRPTIYTTDTDLT